MYSRGDLDDYLAIAKEPDKAKRIEMLNKKWVQICDMSDAIAAAGVAAGLTKGTTRDDDAGALD